MQPVYLVLCNDYFTLHIHSCWVSVIVNMDKVVPHKAAENAEATVSYSCINEEQVTGCGAVRKINGCDQMQDFSSSKN